MRYVAVVAAVVLVGAVWATFAVPDDPSCIGDAPVPGSRVRPNQDLDADCSTTVVRDPRLAASDHNAAVDRYRLPGDQIAFLRREIRAKTGDLFRRAEAAGRLSLDEELLGL